MIESSLYFKVKHIAMPQAFKFGYDAPQKRLSSSILDHGINLL